MSTHSRDSLEDRIREAIRSPDFPAGPDEFDRLALDIFSYQFAANPIYRSYCENRGMGPATVDSWMDIPPVPTDAFKAAPIFCGDVAEAAVSFRTSGTSKGSGTRGQHHLRETRIYEEALVCSFRKHILPDREEIDILSLVAPPSEAADSSLSFMIGHLGDECGTDVTWAIEDGELRPQRVLEKARQAEQTGRPLALLGTSFAFVHLLDWLGESDEVFSLPSGSRIMDTGGFKGRARTIPKAELYAALSKRTGVPVHSIVNEYGMTEMSSQFYDGIVGHASDPDSRVYQAPRWVRTVSCNAETLAPLPAGELGILRHIDLANLDSVIALQTADLGRMRQGGLELRGRAAGAESRGYSLAMDDLLRG